MNQTEQQYLDACENSFLLFCERYPDYPQTEASARQMATELRAANLSPTNADHLAVIWQKIRPAAAIRPPESSRDARRTRGVLEAAFLATGHCQLCLHERIWRPDSLFAFPSRLHELSERQPDNLSDLQAAHRLSDGFEFLQDFRIEENIVAFQHESSIHTLSTLCL